MMKRIIVLVTLAVLSLCFLCSCETVGDITDAIESKAEDIIGDVIEDAVNDAVNDAFGEGGSETFDTSLDTESDESESETVGAYEEEEEWEGPII